MLQFSRHRVSDKVGACASGIRLAGATNDVHVFDVRTGRWEKISPQGEPPSPRAAHAAAAVGNMVVIQVTKKSVEHPAWLSTAFGHTYMFIVCRVASDQQAWHLKTCMYWTLQTQIDQGGTGESSSLRWDLSSKHAVVFRALHCDGNSKVLQVLRMAA